MIKFKYTAKDKTGKTVSGIAEAVDERSLVGMLRKQELIITSVKDPNINVMKMRTVYA